MTCTAIGQGAAVLAVDFGNADYMENVIASLESLVMMWKAVNRYKGEKAKCTLCEYLNNFPTYYDLAEIIQQGIFASSIHSKQQNIIEDMVTLQQLHDEYCMTAVSINDANFFPRDEDFENTIAFLNLETHEVWVQ